MSLISCLLPVICYYFATPHRLSPFFFAFLYFLFPPGAENGSCLTHIQSSASRQLLLLTGVSRPSSARRQSATSAMSPSSPRAPKGFASNPSSFSTLQAEREAIVHRMLSTPTTPLPSFLSVLDRFEEDTQVQANETTHNLKELKDYVTLAPLGMRAAYPGDRKRALPVQCAQPSWLLRADMLALPVNEKKETQVRITLVLSILQSKAPDWGSQRSRPQWVLTLLGGTMQHLRKFGHGLILRTEWTDQTPVLDQSIVMEEKFKPAKGEKTHLQGWELKQCTIEHEKQKKEFTVDRCETDFQRENFNWEKHLMLWDYLMLQTDSGEYLLLAVNNKPKI